ncbi:MAG: ABC transporter substrate-binding protein, partial [Clostridia bacterium]|nr:ABC transporter substrate-binding protein [Clostridia bacterium]
MFKKILCVLMVVAMAACLFAACGDKKDGDTKAAGKTLLIGGTGPLTGDASSYGISVKNGAQLAVDEINKAGGINGIQLAFDMKDDLAAAADASTGYDALMDAGMKVSIGSVTSGSCAAFGDKAAGDNLFFITPSASAANVIEKGKNAFRVCFGDPDQGVLAAEELVKNYKNIGCIYDTSDPYSKGIYDAFEAKMKELNATYKVQSFDAENKKDFSTQAEALKDCDVVFTPFYYTEAGLVCKALVAKGSKAVVYGCDGLDGIKDQIEGVDIEVKYITPFDVNSKDEKVSKFVNDYKAAYEGKEPDQFAADGYDAVYAIYTALVKIGINEENLDMTVSEYGEKMIAAFTDPSFSYAGVTGNMTWDASGACT